MSPIFPIAENCNPRDLHQRSVGIFGGRAAGSGKRQKLAADMNGEKTRRIKNKELKKKTAGLEDSRRCFCFYLFLFVRGFLVAAFTIGGRHRGFPLEKVMVVQGGAIEFFRRLNSAALEPSAEAPPRQRK